MDSAGGVYKTVSIAANGTVSGSDPSTDVVNVTAEDDESGTFAGYFAVYKSTSTSLMAHAEDEDGGQYTRLVSTNTTNYTPGTVYGKTITLTSDMATASATGSTNGHSWKNLGLSVKWAEFNVGSSSEYSYNCNVDNTEGGTAGAVWPGWRIPTRAEVLELFYASERQWVTGSNNGVKFICNGSYVAMGAGGRYRERDDGRDWTYNDGSEVCFYIDETTSGGVNGTVRVWTQITGEENSIGFGASNLGNNMFYFSNYAAMRLVRDYE